MNHFKYDTKCNYKATQHAGNYCEVRKCVTVYCWDVAYVREYFIVLLFHTFYCVSIELQESTW